MGLGGLKAPGIARNQAGQWGYVRIMRRLPLFPLPIVLFPGAITSLHVF